MSEITEATNDRMALSAIQQRLGQVERNLMARIKTMDETSDYSKSCLKRTLAEVSDITRDLAFYKSEVH